jgi:hypothetical protein
MADTSRTDCTTVRPTGASLTSRRIVITFDTEFGFYEARYVDTESPVGVGDDQREAAEHLMRAARRMEG